MDRPADMTLRGTERAGSIDAPAPSRSAPAARPGAAGPVRGAERDERAGLVSNAEPDGKPDLAAAVAAAQRGDEHAFRIIYRDVQPRLLRYLRAMVGDDAEDVASEAWLQITRDLAGFHGDSDGFRGWAATIARHRAMDHQRRHRRRPQSSGTSIDDLAGLAAGHDTAESALETVSTEAAIAMISELPRDQAEAVMLRVVMGLDAESAGRILGKKAGAVRTAAYRGLRRLATGLERTHGGTDSAGNKPETARGQTTRGQTSGGTVSRRAVQPKASEE